ncbi:MAG: carbohydrate-binding protein, partial [Thermoplasmata archaeon]
SRVYTGVTSTLNSVSFQPTDEKLDGKRALVVGSSGTVLFWDGVTFTKINGANGTLNKVSWAPSGQCALIVGSNGGIYKYEGGTITKVESNTTTTFYSVAWHPSGSHAIIVGASGKAYKYNGKSLTKLTTGTTSALYDIAFNPSNGNAIIVGSSGKVLKYNSVSGNFSILQSGTTKTLYGLGYRQLGDYACIVGSSGTILKYDGVSFTKLDIPPGLGTNTIYGVTFPVNGNPWIAASGGKAFQISFLKETAYNYEGVVLYYYPTIRQLVIKIENQQGSLNGDYKYVRLGYNGWASGTIQDVKLVKYQTQSGSKWISAIDLPKNVSTVNFCFHDGAGNWANNNGNNWNVALSTLPQSDVDYSKTRLYGLVHNYYVVVFNGGAIPPQLSLHNIMTQPLFLYRSGTVYFPSSSNGEYSFLVGDTGSYLGTVPIFPGRYVIVLPRNSSMLDDAEIINVELKPGYNFVDIYAN